MKDGGGSQWVHRRFLVPKACVPKAARVLRHGSSNGRYDPATSRRVTLTAKMTAQAWAMPRIIPRVMQHYGAIALAMSCALAATIGSAKVREGSLKALATVSR